MSNEMGEKCLNVIAGLIGLRVWTTYAKLKTAGVAWWFVWVARANTTQTAHY